MKWMVNLLLNVYLISLSYSIALPKLTALTINHFSFYRFSSMKLHSIVLSEYSLIDLPKLAYFITGYCTLIYCNNVDITGIS